MHTVLEVRSNVLSGPMATVQGRAFARVKGLLPAPLRDAMELFLTRNSVLNLTGWRSSREASVPIDAAGEPLPWFTYPAIRFLEPRLSKSMRVFEYGAGNSTLWWASRVRSVQSVEHHREWFDRITAALPGNAKVSFAEGDDYIQAAQGQFDVIVIDGIMRPQCAGPAVAALSKGGVIVWDNTDEEADFDGHRFLERSGFRRVDFWGIGPLLTYEWCTSVFYREGNCLEI